MGKRRSTKSREKTRMQTFGTSSREGHDSSGFYGRQMYADGNVQAPDASCAARAEIEDGLLNRIFQKSSEAMSELPDNCVHLMVTSPPYNVGKDYDDDLPLGDYLAMLKRVWEETYRVLVPGGRACINVANIGRKPYLPLSHMISRDAMDVGFLMRGEIIWNKDASAGPSCAWGSWRSAANPVLRDVHEYIMVFSKLEFGRSRPRDKEATIGRDEFLECTQSIWNFPAESAKRAGHPAPFPVELPRRLIELYTFGDEIVLDPFMGSGTTALASEISGRKWVGYEVSADYIEVANGRLKGYEDECSAAPLFPRQ